MAQIFSDSVIKSRLSLLTVLDHYGISYTNEGGERYVCSIRREDNTPSCHIDAEKNIFNDFGGGNVGGNVYNLVAYLEFGIDHKLSSEEYKEVLNFIGNNFRSELGSDAVLGYGSQWTPISISDYKKIGICGESVTMNTVDLQTMSPNEAMAECKKYGKLSMRDLVMSNDSNNVDLYHKIIAQKAFPFLQKQKAAYLSTISALIDCTDGAEREQLREKAEDLYTKCETSYSVLKRAIKPLSAEEKAKMGASVKYRFDVRSYNVYPVEDTILQLSTGKSHMQCGNIANSELKKNALESNEAIISINGLSESDIAKLKNAPFKYAAFRQGKGEYQVRILSGVQNDCLKMLGKPLVSNMSYNASFENDTQGKLTRFGLHFKAFLNSHGLTEKDVASALDIDSRRINEVLRKDFKLSDNSRGVLAQLKRYTNYDETLICTSTYVVPSNRKHALFKQMPPEKQKEYVLMVYNSDYNIDLSSPTGKVKTPNEIYATCVSLNDKYLYRLDDLQRINLDYVRAATDEIYNPNVYQEIRSYCRQNGLHYQPITFKNVDFAKMDQMLKELTSDSRLLPLSARYYAKDNAFKVSLYPNPEHVDTFIAKCTENGIRMPTPALRDRQDGLSFSKVSLYHSNPQL